MFLLQFRRRSLFVFSLLVVALLVAACSSPEPETEVAGVGDVGSSAQTKEDSDVGVSDGVDDEGDVATSGGADAGTDEANDNLDGPIQGQCTLEEPCVIYTIEQLQAIGDRVYRHLVVDIDEPLTGHYILGQDIDASATADWHDGDGFVPLGSKREPFEGTLDGGGKQIIGLYIDRWASEDEGDGLFSVVGEGAVIRNVHLVEANIASGTRFGTVGALVGINKGTVEHVSATGQVTYTKPAGVPRPPAVVGGLVGLNEGAIVDAQSDVTLNSEIGGGGMVGRNGSDGTMTGARSGAKVLAEMEVVGGLVALNEGLIENSHTLHGAEVKVTRAAEGWGSEVGGLVGENKGKIRLSTSAATVEGYSNVGGFVGSNHAGGTIEDSASGGAVIGYDNHLGGLVGRNDGEGTLVARTYSTGVVYAKMAVTPDRSGPVTDMGGLVGWNVEGAAIVDSYSTASFDGDTDVSNVGGLVGTNGWAFGVGSITSSYSTGAPPAGPNTGGLVGDDGGGVVENSYWNREASGIAASGGGTGKTTDEMHDPATFAGWDESVWDLQSGTYPTLKATPAPDGW